MNNEKYEQLIEDYEKVLDECVSDAESIGSFTLYMKMLYMDIQNNNRFNSIKFLDEFYDEDKRIFIEHLPKIETTYASANSEIIGYESELFYSSELYIMLKKYGVDTSKYEAVVDSVKDYVVKNKVNLSDKENRFLPDLYYKIYELKLLNSTDYSNGKEYFQNQYNLMIDDCSETQVAFDKIILLDDRDIYSDLGIDVSKSEEIINKIEVDDIDMSSVFDCSGEIAAITVAINADAVLDVMG